LGKRANCQVVVSAHYVAEEPESSRPLHWPVCARLYLPEGWASDPKHREISHVPDEVGFILKPQIALSMGDLSREWDVPFEVVVADSGYGENPSFLKGLEERKVAYVCGVESTFGVRRPEEVRAAKEAGAPPYKGRGQPPKERPAPLYSSQGSDRLPARWGMANAELEGGNEGDLEQANGGAQSASGDGKPTPQQHPRSASHSSGGLADR